MTFYMNASSQLPALSLAISAIAPHFVSPHPEELSALAIGVASLGLPKAVFS
ncbi:MAG: hypothetical protein ABI040_12120 [Rhodoferax sp.]